MKALFRLYQNHYNKQYSTFFDMIDGDHETKQTKGFAYVLAKHPELVKLLLQHIRSMTDVELPTYEKMDFIQIDAEMLSVGIQKIRRDITITFFKDNVRQFVIIIEAKSASLNNVQKEIINQLNSYMEPMLFPVDANAPKLGITLTKYRMIHLKEHGFISLAWTDILRLMKKLIALNNKQDMGVAQEYMDFLSGVSKGMHFYEVEVLSVAAGGTSELPKKHFVHACPHYSAGYKYKDPLFITFREKGGGEMECLYKIDQILIMDPHSSSLEAQLNGLPEQVQERILQYILDRHEGFGFDRDEDYRFYILNQKETIHLNHRPKPLKNNTGARYFTLSELLNGKPIVQVMNDNG